jgi:hypothetical protein
MEKHEAACLLLQNRTPPRADQVTTSVPTARHPPSPTNDAQSESSNTLNSASVAHWSSDIPTPPVSASLIGYHDFLNLLFQPPDASNAGASDLAILPHSASDAGVNAPPSLPTKSILQQSLADFDWLNYHQAPPEGSSHGAWPFESFELDRGREHMADHTSTVTGPYTPGPPPFDTAFSPSGI